MRHILGCFALLIVNAAAGASLDRITNADAVGGLRQALNDGSLAAVAKLGIENGYFANPQVKIPLPPSLQRVEGAMRAFGMRKQADELVLKMNRAAEAAAPEAKQLLVDAVKKMRPTRSLLRTAAIAMTAANSVITSLLKRETVPKLSDPEMSSASTTVSSRSSM